MNLNKYFTDNNIEINFDKELPIFKSSSRLSIFYEVEELLKKKIKYLPFVDPLV